MNRIIAAGIAAAVLLMSLSADAQIERKTDAAAKWQWLTKNQYRVVAKCTSANAEQKHRIAWAQIDLDELYKYQSSPKQMFNPDSLRVIEYDGQTGKPVKYDKTLAGDKAYYVPAKIDQWPRRHQIADTIRMPQISWIRRNGDDAQAVYVCYFDFAGSGEQEALSTPAFIGTGDALAFGAGRALSTVRGVPLIIDWDGDGDKDILAAVGMVPERTVYFYENTGDSFNKGFARPLGVTARIGHKADADNDGKGDVVCKGGYYSDVDANAMTKWVAIDCPMDNEIGQILKDSRSYKWYIADWDGDGVNDLLVGNSYWKEYGWADAFDESGQWKNGPLRGWFYFYKNTGTNNAFKLAEPVQLFTADGNKAEIYGHGDLVVADFTGDGLPDIIAGDFIDNIHIFRNIGTSSKPLLAPRERLMTTEGTFEADYQAISVTVDDFDNDGDNDLFIRGENDDTGLLENTGKFTKDGLPIFEPVRYLMCGNDFSVEGQLPVCSVYDWDGDGDWDLIFGNSPGFVGWYECVSPYPALKFAKRRLFEDSKGPIRVIAGYNGSIQGPAEKKWGYTVPAAGDWDGDGKADIIMNSIWGNIQWHRNIGSSDMVTLADARNVEVQWQGKAPKPLWRWWDPLPNQWSTQWRCNVVMIDWNRDGLMDAVSLDWEGYLVLHQRYMEEGRLCLSEGKRIFLDQSGNPWRINPKTPGGSGRRKFTFTDWDGDGDRDFIVDDKSFGGNVVLYINAGDDSTPRFVPYGAICDIIVSGHTCSPAAVDIDGDGRDDLLLAAEDGHFYCFHRSYIDDKQALRAVIQGDSQTREMRNVVLFDENIAIGQIIGGQISGAQSCRGKKSFYALKETGGTLTAALDFRGTIDIGHNTKFVMRLKAEPAISGESAELMFVKVYTIGKSPSGDTASNSLYYPQGADGIAAAAFTIEAKACEDKTVRINCDGKWHTVSVDLASGAGMPQSGMLKPSTILRRMDLVFKAPVAVYIDDAYMTD